MNGADNLMIKNTLIDLNNHLFEQMERLNDDSLTDDQMSKEIARSKAMTDIGDKIIQNANVILKAKIAYGDVDSSSKKDRSQILLGNENEIHKTTK